MQRGRGQAGGLRAGQARCPKLGGRLGEDPREEEGVPRADHGERVGPRGPVRGAARRQGGAQPQPPHMQGELGLGDRAWGQGGGGARWCPEQPSEALQHGGVVPRGKRARVCRRQGAQQVVAAGEAAKEEEQPRRLQAGDRWDPVQEQIVAGAHVVQVAGHERGAAKGGAQHDEALGIGWLSPIASPGSGPGVRRQRIQERGGLFTGGVPGPGFAQVHMHVGAVA